MDVRSNARIWIPNATSPQNLRIEPRDNTVFPQVARVYSHPGAQSGQVDGSSELFAESPGVILSLESTTLDQQP